MKEWGVKYLTLLHLTNGRRQWQPTPVLLPGKSHGWRRLVSYSLWDLEESDMTDGEICALFYILKNSQGTSVYCVQCAPAFTAKQN